MINKNGDIIVGGMLATASYIYSHVNAIAAMFTGLVILGIMILRLRKEWRHKDD